MTYSINQKGVEVRDAEIAISEILIQVPMKREEITPAVLDEETGEITTPAVTKAAYPLEDVRFRYRVKAIKGNEEIPVPNNMQLVEGTIPDNHQLLQDLVTAAMTHFKNRPEVTEQP
jgi:hypothetical protein